MLAEYGGVRACTGMYRGITGMYGHVQGIPACTGVYPAVLARPGLSCPCLACPCLSLPVLSCLSALSALLLFYTEPARKVHTRIKHVLRKSTPVRHYLRG